MAMPEAHLRQITRWCQQRVPEHALHQVRVERAIRGASVTIVEARAPWREDYGPEWTRRPIAQLRYASSQWRLYWPDRNTRWHLIDDTPAQTSPVPLLTEIDNPRRAFW